MSGISYASNQATNNLSNIEDAEGESPYFDEEEENEIEDNDTNFCLATQDWDET